MKTVIFGALAVLSFGAVANDTLPIQDLKMDDRQCTVRTSFAHTVMTGKCSYWDEVMVGIASLEPLTIRCARLEVTCREAAE